MSLTPGTGVSALGDIANRGVFLRLATDPVIRLWSGRGLIRVAANDLDPTAQEYDGFGEMRNMPEIDRLLNGAARRLTITLSGLAERAALLVDDDMVGVQGCRARIGHMRYDRAWRPTTEIRWAWDGLLDEIGLEAVQKGEGHEWTLSISMSSATVNRNRSRLLFWTPKDQAQAHPTDSAYQFVPGYNAGTTRPYPPR